MTDSKRFYLLMLILYVLMLLGCDKPELKQLANKSDTFLPFSPNYVLNAENIYREIMLNDIKFSDVVLRQSILETGHYTSYNCLERNNLFGMTGGTKTSDNIHGYAIYNTWMESVEAYKVWQAERLTPYWDNYYTFLTDWNYAESEEYERKLKSIRLIIVKH